jgi:PPM family protein phosphatase
LNTRIIKSNVEAPFSWATAPKALAGWAIQDSFLTLKAKGGIAAGVFDGISSGGPGSTLCSQLAAKLLFHNLNMMNFRKLPVEIAVSLQNYFQIADRQLKEMTKTGRIKNDQAGTTATVSVVRWPDSARMPLCDVITISAGDSRSYAFLPDDSLHCLTIDNEYGGVLKGFGLIKHRLGRTNQSFLSSLTKEEQLDTMEKRQAFLERNIIDVGLFSDPDATTPQYAATIVQVPIGTRLILCSDGLHDNCHDDLIASILKQTPPLYAAKALAEAALKVSQGKTLLSKPDDVTVLELSTERLIP